jgi:hypothetical protein
MYLLARLLHIFWQLNRLNRRTDMRLRSILASTVFALTALGSTAAFAGATVDGINLPSSAYFDSTQSWETLVNPAVGANTLSGVFQVGLISNSQGGAVTYTYGQGGAFLTGAFQGFTFDAVTSNPGAGTLFFTGGSIKYVVNTSNIFTVSSGTATDITTDSTGSKTFLTGTPQTINAAGDTLEIVLVGGDFTTFTASTAIAYVDLTGGDAFPSLDTDAIINPFGNQLADLFFQGSANRSGTGGAACGNDFGVCGSNSAKGNIVPEPVTVSVFGAGLVGAAALRRRKAKKA